MKYERKTIKPIGMKSFCDEIDKICSSSVIYKNTNITIPSYIIRMDQGQGRKEAIRYAAEAFEDAEILDMTSGLDKFLYLSYNGTTENYYANKRILSDAAVYKNRYTGLIGCDPLGLVDIINYDKSYTSVLDDYAEICSYATVFFFIKKELSDEEYSFVSKLAYKCNTKEIAVEDYSSDELTLICERRLEHYNIGYDNNRKVHEILKHMIEISNMSSPCEAILLARSILDFVDFSSFTPKLKYSRIKALADKYCK